MKFESVRTDAHIVVDSATSQKEARIGQKAKSKIKQNKLGGSNHPNGDDSCNSFIQKTKQQKDQEL